MLKSWKYILGMKNWFCQHQYKITVEFLTTMIFLQKQNLYDLFKLKMGEPNSEKVIFCR